MAGPKPALSPGQAVARVQAEARRAGGAWNRHDAAAVRSNLELAREFGLPRLMIEYGGVRIRFDLQVDGVAASEPAADVVLQVGGDDGERMEEDVAAADAPSPVPAVALPPAAPVAGGDAAQAQAAASAAELLRLQAKSQRATERNRRQKAARKARDEAARLMAAHAAERSGKGGGDDQLNIVHVPLWSAAMGQTKAMTRLFEEVMSRCSMAASQRGLGVRGLPVVTAAQSTR